MLPCKSQHRSLLSFVKAQPFKNIHHMSASNILLFIGSVLVLHAAYSCLHYRELLTDLEESGQIMLAGTVVSSVPPLDVLIELFLAFGLILGAELMRKGSGLQPVTSQTRKKRLVAPSYVSRDFDIYSTRGGAL